MILKLNWGDSDTFVGW